MSVLNELADGVLCLTLNRPQRLNAIDEATARALLQAVREADADPRVRVILLRGEGRAFCAGRDITEPPTPEILDLVQSVSLAMVQCGKPIVCALHGWVVGAGVEWMLDTDVTVAARSARFKLPEASIGVFVTGGITAVLPRVAGLMRAKALLLLGEAFSAEQAERWGLVSRVVDDAALDDEARQAASRLAALDPRVASRFKHVLNQLSLADFAQSIALESQMQTELMGGNR